MQGRLDRSLFWVLCPDMGVNPISSEMVIHRKTGKILRIYLKDSKARAMSDCPEGSNVCFSFIDKKLCHLSVITPGTRNSEYKKNIEREVKEDSQQRKVVIGIMTEVTRNRL